MSDDTGKRILFATFFLATAMIVWLEISKEHRVPVPSRFLAEAIVWGVLGLTAPFLTYPLVGAYSIGLVLALYYENFVTTKGLTDAQVAIDKGFAE